MNQYDEWHTKRYMEPLEKIIKALSSKTFPRVITSTYIESLGNPMENWSMSNQILCILNDTVDARTYLQWRMVGRYPKKGTKAFYIFGPRTKKVKIVNKETDEEEEKEHLYGFRQIPVFRIEDTEGAIVKPAKKFKTPPLLDVAKKMGARVVYSKSIHGEYGSFSSDTKMIRLCAENPIVFFHELVHLVHSSFEKLEGGQDPEQEAIAQLAACVLGKMYGIDDIPYTWNYIAGYSQTKDPAIVGLMCMRVLNKVKKILDIIFKESGEINVKK